MAVVETWFAAWRAAATGPQGFWRTQRVGEHFRTASATSALPARMVDRVLTDRPELRTVVELGAGEGLLLHALHRLRPDLRLIGIDLRPPPRPVPGVDWVLGEYEVTTGWRGPAGQLLAQPQEPALVICSEWLDDLPCPVVGARDGRWHQVLLDADGREHLGAPPSSADQDWLDRWWPIDAGHGEPVRAEVGRTRDEAWQRVVEPLGSRGGAALMIDYGHVRPGRPPGGSLTGFVGGRQVRPEPSRRMNLTADVAVDAVADAGQRTGARTEFLIDQRTAVTRLLGTERQDRGAGVLAALQEAGERHALTSALGGHWWLLQDIPRSADLAP